MERIHSYDPVYRADATILILGTMPSVKSLEMGFYYAHERNAFWPIIARVFDAALPQTVEEKKALVRENQIALWDVLASCERVGSLDSNIRQYESNDIASLLEKCPLIKRILLNGGTAQTLFVRHFPNITIAREQMPSTSPAYTLAFEKKYQAWQQALRKAYAPC